MSNTSSTGRYVAQGEIARGGMGVVLRVRDRNLDRTLALKRMLAPPDEAGTEIEVARFARFMEEAQITAQLDHPSIVPIHELGEDEEGRTYYTMRLVKGRELGEVIREVHGDRQSVAASRESAADFSKETNAAFSRDTATGNRSWNLTRVVGVLVRVCQTMAYAHGRGVIHRDLKPANIMVGDLGEVYVMDWGLARMAGRPEVRDLRLSLEKAGVTGLTTVSTSSLEIGDSVLDAPLRTMDGTVIGTPAYMAPEQAAGRLDEVDFRTDIYALGAILYELLAGHPPYTPPGQSISPRSVLKAVLQGPPENLALKLSSKWPPELAAICEKAMRRNPAERYASCLELADELQAWLDDRVVKAHATGPLVEARKWVRRNRALASTTAAAMVAVITALGVATWVQTRSASRQRAAFENESAARKEATATLVESLHQQGVQAHSHGETGPALAYWAQVLEHEPQHRRAAARIASTLLYEPPPVIARTFPGAAGTRRAQFSRDGAWVAMPLEGGRIGVYTTTTGELRWRLPHSGKVWAIEFSPDGRWLAVGVMDGDFHGPGRLDCWDLQNGRRAFPTELLPGIVQKAGFNSNGSRLTATVLDTVARVWTVPEGRLILEHRQEPTAQSLAFDPATVQESRLNSDGRKLLVGRGDGSVELHDVETGALCHVPGRSDGLHPAQWLAWSPDESRFAVGDADGLARVYDGSTGQPVTPPMKHALEVEAISFDPAGRWLLTGSADGEARLWDASNGTLVVPPLRHGAAVRDARFTSDGAKIVTASDDGTARIWSSVTGEALFRTEERGGLIFKAQLDPSGRRLFTARTGRGVALWELGGSAVPWSIRSGIFALSQSAGLARVAIAGDDQLALLDLNSGRAVGEIPAHQQSGVSAVHVSADGRWVASAHSRTVRRWRVDESPALVQEYDTDTDCVWVAISGRGNTIAAFSTDGSATIWSGNSLSAVTNRVVVGTHVPTEAWISDDGTRLAMAGVGITNFLWDARSGRPIASGRCWAMDWTDQGVGLRAHGARAEFWDADRGQLLATPTPLIHDFDIYSVRFSPDQRRVLTASYDNTARIWDAGTGATLLAPLRHRAAVTSGAWSPDGLRVATTAADGSIYLWEATTGERLAGPIAGMGELSELSKARGFLPDGRRMLVLGPRQEDPVTPRRADLWDFGPAASEEIPDWLGLLAQTAGGYRIQRLAESGRFRTEVHELPLAERLAAQERFRKQPGDDGYSRLARWFFADPETRPASPSAPWATPP